MRPLRRVVLEARLFGGGEVVAGLGFLGFALRQERVAHVVSFVAVAGVVLGGCFWALLHRRLLVKVTGAEGTHKSPPPGTPRASLVRTGGGVALGVGYTAGVLGVAAALTNDPQVAAVLLLALGVATLLVATQLRSRERAGGWTLLRAPRYRWNSRSGGLGVGFLDERDYYVDRLHEVPAAAPR